MKKLCLILSVLLCTTVASAQDRIGWKKVGQIVHDYKVAIAEGDITNHIGLEKFGHHSNLSTTRNEIWDGEAVYSFNADDTFTDMWISSSNGADQGMAYEVQGIDCEYNFATVTVSTDASDGNTFVPLVAATASAASNGCDGSVYGSGAVDDEKWWRIFRVKSVHTAAAAGDIYISKDNTDAGGDGIPDTATDIQAKVQTGFNQTLMTQWTVPIGKTFYLTSIFGGSASQASNRFAHVEVYVRPFGGVDQLKKIYPLSNETFQLKLDFPLMVPARSDIIVRGIASASVEASAGFSGWWE